MRNYIFLDLDGTVTDPAMGITNSVMHALRKYGMEVPPREELYSFIGPPLQASFQEFCGFDDEEGKRAVEYYREYYRDNGIFENILYPGMKELLAELSARGKHLVLVTSKPHVFAKRILSYFEIAPYFEAVYGSELDGTHVEKEELIAYTLSDLGVSPAEAVMVGDRRFDIEGAKKHGLSSVGVLYGYGSREEIEACAPDRIAETVDDLYKILG